MENMSLNESLNNFIVSIPEPVALFDTNFNFLVKSNQLKQEKLDLFLEDFNKKNQNETYLSQIIQLNLHENYIISYGKNNVEVRIVCQKFEVEKELKEAIYVSIKDIISNQGQLEVSDATHFDRISFDRMRALAEISAGISHEINNPLTVIVAKVEYIKSLLKNIEVNKVKIGDSLDKVYHHSERITKIIKSLKNFSREASADLAERISAATLINDAVNLLSENIRNNGIQIDTDSSQINIDVMCVPSEITQILVNLLGNAIDALAGHRNPVVQIVVRRLTNQNVQICVIDNGSGIAPEQAHKVFESFYTTKPRDKGTGLGLSLSKFLAQKNKGDLYLNTEHAQTCFSLELKGY
jgi:C4-dicarboxylate-specific signal transduction histidine kinase